MSSALIAEDEPLLAEAPALELKRLWPGLAVIASVGDGASAVREAMACRPQLCFLDIRMPGLSGLEAAQALAGDWPDAAPFPLLVFVTAYDQYALQAFDAGGVDYLVKPVEPARLAACVERLQRRLAEQAPAASLARTVQQLRSLLDSAPQGARLEVVQAAVGNTVHMVPLDEVLYFEAADKYLRVVTAEREHLIRMSLRELLPQLDASRFWQVHRGLVVRARAIATAQRDESGKVRLTLRDRPNEKLTASRLYAHRFRGL